MKSAVLVLMRVTSRPSLGAWLAADYVDSYRIRLVMRTTLRDHRDIRDPWISPAGRLSGGTAMRVGAALAIDVGVVLLILLAMFVEFLHSG